MTAYQKFLAEKSQLGGMHGFDPIDIPAFLFDFQASLVDWSIRKGRAALFADCGLGKTPMQLVWADNVVKKHNKPVLILTPLAVAAQTVREGSKFGIDCERSRGGSVCEPRIVVANYESLHKFDSGDFVGVVCDESSILKSFNGKRRSEITKFMRKMPCRLLATATSAPNDYIELGTSSEALGNLGYMDVLNRFFKNDQNNSAVGRIRGEQVKWRFKGHSELAFWRWVCSWARAIRKPSDLGFSDDDFILPELIETEHIIQAKTLADGMLFSLPAVGLDEQREERRRTISERCEKVAGLVESDDSALVWCHLNDEGDLLDKIIPGAVQVAGKHSDELKEERLLAFANGEIRVLVTKQKIGGWGLNYQHCSHVTCFPSHSFEQYYQGVRRCWRFGQENPVHVDMVASEGEVGVLKNLQRKAVQADRMFTNLVLEMNEALSIHEEPHTHKEVVPSWL